MLETGLIQNAHQFFFPGESCNVNQVSIITYGRVYLSNISLTSCNLEYGQEFSLFLVSY